MGLRSSGTRRAVAVLVAVAILAAVCGAAVLMLARVVDLNVGGAAARSRQLFASFAFAFLTNSFV